ncbi:MAG: hypothetical protein RL662_1458 [Bacteroidota bacterium]|jgi:hypothetical protein
MPLIRRITKEQFYKEVSQKAYADAIVSGLGYVMWTTKERLIIRQTGNPNHKPTSTVLTIQDIAKMATGNPNQYNQTAPFANDGHAYYHKEMLAVVMPYNEEDPFEKLKKQSEQDLIELCRDTCKLPDGRPNNELFNKLKRGILYDELSMLDEMPTQVRYSKQITNYFDYHKGFESKRWAQRQATISATKDTSMQDSIDEMMRQAQHDGMFYTILPTINFSAGVGFTLAGRYTLAGQGKYITSKGLVRNINFARKTLTKHAQPYAQAGKFIKWGGIATFGASAILDYYAYVNGGLSGENFAVNTGVSTWAFGMGLYGMGMASLPGSIFYFSISSLYPGGVEGYGADFEKYCVPHPAGRLRW